MKPSSSVKDFKAVREVPRVQTTTTPALHHQEVDNEMSEVSDKPRSRTSAPEGAISQQQQQQLLSVDGSPPNKGLENRTPKSNEKDDVAFEQSSSANASVKTRKEGFVKNFPDIAANDKLLEYYYCAYSRDILFPGFMYVTNEWICFNSKIMGKKDIRISVQSIVSITKARTAKLIPNAICVATHQERHVFASLVSRDRTFSLLMKIWKPQPKPEDDDSLNGSSQNGERNDVIDDISISSDDVTPSGSDEFPYGENRGFPENQTGSTSEQPEVGGRRQTVANGDVRDQSGRNLESSPISSSSPRDRRTWQKDSTSYTPLVSTTTIVLTVTAFLTVVLILSAGILTLRLIQLQAQVESTLLPLSTTTSSHHKTFVSEQELLDEVGEDVYQLKHEHHVTTIQRLHNLLEVHLRLLDKVNQSLKSLQLSSTDSCVGLSSADEYSQDSNS